jgi:hypothetical protein
MTIEQPRVGDIASVSQAFAFPSTTAWTLEMSINDARLDTLISPGTAARTKGALASGAIMQAGAAVSAEAAWRELAAALIAHRQHAER